jgi:hypothetical protein
LSFINSSSFSSILTYENQLDKDKFLTKNIFPRENISFVITSLSEEEENPYLNYFKINNIQLNPFYLISDISKDVDLIVFFLKSLGLKAKIDIRSYIIDVYTVLGVNTTFIAIAEFLSLQDDDEARLASLEIFSIFSSVFRLELSNNNNTLYQFQSNISLNIYGVDEDNSSFVLRLVLLNAFLCLNSKVNKLGGILILDDITNYLSKQNDIYYINQMEKIFIKHSLVSLMVIYNSFFHKEYSLNYVDLLELVDFKIFFKQAIDYNFSIYQSHGFSKFEAFEIVNGIIELESDQYLILTHRRVTIVDL